MRYGLNTLDYILWISSILSHWALLFLLVRGKHCPRFPLFTAYIAFSCVEYPALFAVNRYMTSADYYFAYYAGLALATLFVALSAIELFREVIGPYNTVPVSVVISMLAYLLIIVCVGLVVALLTRTYGNGAYGSIEVLDKFAKFVITAALVVALAISLELNLPWSKRVSGVCAGMLFCMAVQSVNTVCALHGPLAKYNRPIGMLAYVIAQAVWIWTFRKQPKIVPANAVDDFIDKAQVALEQLRERKRAGKKVLTVS